MTYKFSVFCTTNSLGVGILGDVPFSVLEGSDFAFFSGDVTTSESPVELLI